VDGPYSFAPGLSRIMYRYLNGGRYADALTVHRHAVAAAKRAGDRSGEAWARVSASQVMYQLTQIPAAIDECQRAAGLLREDDDPAGLARAIGLLGSIHAQLGRHEQSMDCYRQALDLHRRAGYVVGQILMLYNLGCVEQRLGRHDAAERHYQQGLALAGEIGDDRSAGLAYVGLADVAAHQGRHRESAHYGRQAVERHRAVGDHAGATWALIYVGNANVQLGDPDGGELDEALRTFTGLGSRHGVGVTLACLGDAARARGDLADAVTFYTDALAIGDAGELSELRANSHDGLGHAYLALGDRDEATRHWRRAVDLYGSYGSPEADVVRARLAELDP
jgi:tetratricopeptide (TPR) repeat protein